MKSKHLHYGWVMVLIATCALAAHALVVFTFGIFLMPLTAEFNWDRGALSGAFSAFMVVLGVLAIFAGRLSDKYGPRLLVTIAGLSYGIGYLLMSQINSLWQVYIIWGVFMGIGGSACEIPIRSTIPRWFAKKGGTAIGITVAGLGLGTIIWPPLVQWLISTYGWRQSFIILGLIALIINIPLAQFMKHSPQRAGLRPYGEDGTMADKQPLASAVGGLSLRQAIKTMRFWLFGLMKFCYLFYIQVIVVHLVPMAIDIGISAIIAASILSAMAGTGVIGRLSMGFISDRIGGRLALTACFITSILALIWLLFAKETWMFFVFAVVIGLAYGGIAPLITVVPVELFGLRSLGAILGSFMFLSMLGGALGAPLIGSIFDITGSYSLALLICVMVCALALIFSLILLRYRVKMDVALSD